MCYFAKSSKLSTFLATPHLFQKSLTPPPPVTFLTPYFKKSSPPPNICQRDEHRTVTATNTSGSQRTIRLLTIREIWRKWNERYHLDYGYYAPRMAFKLVQRIIDYSCSRVDALCVSNHCFSRRYRQCDRIISDWIFWCTSGPAILNKRFAFKVTMKFIQAENKIPRVEWAAIVITIVEN